MPTTYTVRTHAGRVIASSITARDAADILGIDPHTLTWAIEEHGRCDYILPTLSVWTATEDAR